MVKDGMNIAKPSFVVSIGLARAESCDFRRGRPRPNERYFFLPLPPLLRAA